MQLHTTVVCKLVPFKNDIAEVTGQYSGKNIHQRGFAGTVLAQQSMDGASFKGQNLRP